MPRAEADVTQRKAELRHAMIERRKGLPSDARATAAAAIAARVAALLEECPHARVVSAFLPIGEELDPRPAMVKVRQQGRQLCLPVMSGKTQPLIFRAWQPGDELVTRQWGIREPAEVAAALDPDILLMPLLAFDDRGGRLGYGGGYYDRTLKDLRRRRSVLAVGVAYDLQRVDLVPCLDYDERLDRVFTPTVTIDCRQPR